jgi:hypothetical protein
VNSQPIFTLSTTDRRPGVAKVTTPIKPGVQGRDLALTRRVTDGYLAYLELFHYNDPRVFEVLQDPARADGFLLDVAVAIKDGVVDFVRTHERALPVPSTPGM